MGVAQRVRGEVLGEVCRAKDATEDQANDVRRQRGAGAVEDEPRKGRRAVCEGDLLCLSAVCLEQLAGDEPEVDAPLAIRFRRIQPHVTVQVAAVDDASVGLKT